MRYALTIILSLVFVISIMVACFVFVPMSARQVAYAEVDSLASDTFYMFADVDPTDIDISSLVNSSSGSAGDLTIKKYYNYSSDGYTTYNYINSFRTSTGFYISWFTGDYNGSNCSYFCFVAGSAVSTYHFPSAGWYWGNWVYTNSYDYKFDTKNALASDYIESSNYGLVFTSTPSIASNNIWYVLHQLLLEDVSNAPTYDSFVNINYLTVSKDGGSTQINDVVSATNNLLLMELDNAYLYQETGTPYNYVTVKAVFNFEDDTSTTQMFNLFSDGILTNRYYLLLAAPHDIVNYYTFNGTTTTFLTRDCTSIELSYGDSEDVTVFSEEVNSTAFAHFQSNFTYLMRTGTMYQAFWAGNTYGVQNSRLSGNNLQTLLWSVFQFPFKILFGEYDNVVSSDTYGEYVGGLFNVTILGLDMRAFILSVVSLCVVIGIIKIVLGLRGVKG